MRYSATALIMIAIGGAGLSSAAMIFENVFVEPSNLASDWSYATVDDEIQFSFPNAAVGDAQNDSFGLLSLTYDAVSDVPLTQDTLYLELGGLEGSGQLLFAVVFEALEAQGGDVPSIIGSYSVALDSSQTDDFEHLILFDPGVDATRVRIKKTITLIAPDVLGQLDFADLDGMRQLVTPEPAAAATMLLASGSLMGRRR